PAPAAPEGVGEVLAGGPAPPRERNLPAMLVSPTVDSLDVRQSAALPRRASRHAVKCTDSALVQDRTRGPRKRLEQTSMCAVRLSRCSEQLLHSDSPHGLLDDEFQ